MYAPSSRGSGRAAHDRARSLRKLGWNLTGASGVVPLVRPASALFVAVAAAAALPTAVARYPAGAATAPLDRTCATRAEGPAAGAGPPYGSHDVRFGRLFFLGLDRRHSWRQRRGADGTLKIPVVVSEGPPVTVRIMPLGRARARLDFDVAQWRREGRRVAGGDGQRAVRFHACPASTPRFTDGKPLGTWTGYPGGFLVDRPGCARLTVSAEGMRTVRRRVALGVAPARCRGSAKATTG